MANNTLARQDGTNDIYLCEKHGYHRVPRGSDGECWECIDEKEVKKQWKK